MNRGYILLGVSTTSLPREGVGPGALPELRKSSNVELTRLDRLSDTGATALNGMDPAQSKL